MTDSEYIYWRILSDLLYEPGDPFPSRQFSSRGEREQAEQFGLNIIDVRLLDDDRITYYRGEAADNDSLEAIFAWAQRDAGVAILQTKEDGEWKDCIS